MSVVNPSCESVFLKCWWYAIMIILSGLLLDPKATVATFLAGYTVMSFIAFCQGFTMMSCNQFHSPLLYGKHVSHMR